MRRDFHELSDGTVFFPINSVDQLEIVGELTIVRCTEKNGVYMIRLFDTGELVYGIGVNGRTKKAAIREYHYPTKKAYQKLLDIIDWLPIEKKQIKLVHKGV